MEKNWKYGKPHDKVKFGKYNSDEDVVQNSNNWWKIDEINRPMLYWEQ